MKVPIRASFRRFLACSLLAAGLLGCAEKPLQGLDPKDEPLLHTAIELAEIRILAQEHPDSAQTRLHAFLATADTTALNERLAALWKDPLRGRYFLQALHDSLDAPLRESGTRIRSNGD